MNIKDDLKNRNLYDIHKDNVLNFIVPERVLLSQVQAEKYAVFVHVYYIDCLDKLIGYLKNVPQCADIYFSTDTEEKEKDIKSIVQNELRRNVEVFRVENRGRDIAAFWCVFRYVAMKYDYVCFVHDKKSVQHDRPETGSIFATHCYENLLGSEIYIRNIISLFRENQNIGMVMPTPPYHDGYYSCIGGEWSENFEIARNIADLWGIKSDICKEKPPIAPFGTMFWARTEALETILKVDVSYDFFPEEPLDKTDGTILHAIERLYPYLIQDAGYASAWVSTIKEAEQEREDYYVMLRDLNRELMRQYGIMSQKELINSIKGQGILCLLFNKRIKFKKKIHMLIKRALNEKVYLCLKRIRR